jgi:hypothetical protein
VTYVTDADPSVMRDAITRNTTKLSALLRSASHPERPAVGEWNVGDVAVHVSQIFNVLTATARGSGSIIDDVWELGTLTKMTVGGESDRDFATLAQRVDERSAEFLSAVETMKPSDSRGWIVGDIEVPTATLMGHVLNEIIMHGYDVATAEKLPWKIDLGDAALVVNAFLFPALDNLGSTMVTEGAKGARATLDIRVRGGNSAAFIFDRGSFTIENVAPGRVDCHMSVNPWSFLLVAWNRKSQWPEIAKFKLLAWGLKPWVALRLRGMLKNP